MTTTFLLAWYFACIGPAGYNYFTDQTCSAEFKTYEIALNYRVAGFYEVPYRHKKY